MSRLFSKLHGTVLPIYPILAGIYPVLYIWSANRAQEPAYVILPSLITTLLAVLALYLVAGLLLRSVHKAALATFIISLYALTYGHFITLLGLINLHVRYRTLISAAVVLLLVIFLVTRRASYTNLTRILNAASVLLVLMAVLPAGYYYLYYSQKANPHQSAGGAHPPVEVAAANAAPAAAPANRPDVYFILMDAYSRADFFQDRFHFDDSAFINELKTRGFIFPDCAQGNYPATAPVITSVLNMDYLNTLGLDQNQVLNEDGSRALAPYLQNNLAFQKFRSYGYKIVTFRGFLSLIDFQKVDYYVNFQKDASFGERTETLDFENLYLKTTLFYAYNDQIDAVRKYVPKPLQRYLPQKLDQRFENMYQQNIYSVDTLKKMPELVPGPKFVYAHLYASHWPYLLRPDGSLRTPFNEAVTDAGYLDGVQYLNNHLIDVIDQILAHSKTPPVIILQSDHSYPEGEGGNQWAGTKRLKIFSAYYLPGGGDQRLYDTISPVNNFRLVLNYYLKDPIQLLPDVHYYVRAADGKAAVAPESCLSGAK